jgi:hypothetical protein
LSDRECEEGLEGAEEELCGDGVRLRLVVLDFGLVVEVEGRPLFLGAAASEVVDILFLGLDLDLPGRGGEKDGRARFVGAMVAEARSIVVYLGVDAQL